MFAGGGQTGGRRRDLNAELNLVPFIDLLSTCICFLLVTAVWMQIGALQIKQSRGTDAPAEVTPFDLDIRFSSAQALILQFKKSGKVIKRAELKADSSPDLLQKLDNQLDGLVAAVTGKVESAPANAPSPISAGMIAPHHDVPYGDLVSVIDILRKHRIVNLGVMPTGGA